MHVSVLEADPVPEGDAGTHRHDECGVSPRCAPTFQCWITQAKNQRNEYTHIRRVGVSQDEVVNGVHERKYERHQQENVEQTTQDILKCTQKFMQNIVLLVAKKEIRNKEKLLHR